MTQPRIAVYLASAFPQDPRYAQAVTDLGTAMARRQLTLVYGGSDEGTMKTLADAVLGNGGSAIGVFPRDLPRSYLRQGLTQTYLVNNLAERKAKMLELADAVIALPGSCGTWDEFFDALALAKLNILYGGKARPMGLLNVCGFYDELIAFIRKSVTLGFTPAACADLIASSDSPNDLLELILNRINAAQ